MRPDGSCRACADRRGAAAARTRCTASGDVVPPGKPPRCTLGAGSGARRPGRGPSPRTVPEGDTIHYAANRIRPVLEGHVPDALATPQRRFARDRWPERLAGQRVTRVAAHGKHLFLYFEGGVVIHSHLRMTGKWRVRDATEPAPPRTWLQIVSDDRQVLQLGGAGLGVVTGPRA